MRSRSWGERRPVDRRPGDRKRGRIRLHLGVVVAAVVLGGGVPVVTAPRIACAGGSRAALVVDTGSDVFTYCVQLPDASVSGSELIQLAGAQHGLSYKLGYGGASVCMLAGVGTSADDCFAEYPEFWGYWREAAAGGWTWSSVGPAETAVTDGDVEGWAWGAGDGPDSHPAPPVTAFGSVCAASSGEDRPADKAGGNTRAPKGPAEAADRKPAAPDTQPSEPEAGAEPGASSERGPKPDKKAELNQRGKRWGREAVVSPEGSPLPGPEAAAPGDEGSGEGPPVAGIAGISAALVLLLAGGLARRRSRGAGDPQSSA